MEDNQSFDKLIQDKLKDFHVGFKPADWDRFAADELDQLNQNKPEVFDVIIKDKLVHFSVSYQPDHWTILEHRLDSSLHDTYAEELDQFLQGALRHYSVGYNPQTWILLQQRIKERRQYLRRLFLTKSTEAAIIILALVTFFRFFPNFQFPDPSSEKINPVATIPNASTTKDISNSNTNSSSHPSQTGSLLASTKNKAVVTASGLGAAQDILPSETTNLSSGLGEVLTLNEVNTQAITTTLTPFIERVTAVLPHTNPNLSARLEQQTKRLKFSELTHVDQAEITLQKPLGDFTPHFEPDKFAPKLRIGVFGGADLNIVRVSQFELTVQPQKKPFIGVATDFVAGGYNAGMDLTYQLGRVMLETGIQYTQVNYYNPENYYQLIKEGLVIEKARYTNEANIIELPVHIHYRLSKYPDRFNTSLFAGVSANIITKFTSEAFRTPSQANLRSNNLEAKNELEQEFALFQLAIRNRFSSNEVKNLFYFNTGINLEYLLSDRHGLFMQLGYNHPLQNIGMGGNQDIISQLSSKLGLRMSF